LIPDKPTNKITGMAPARPRAQSVDSNDDASDSEYDGSQIVDQPDDEEAPVAQWIDEDELDGLLDSEDDEFENERIEKLSGKVRAILSV
jgi:hypothetical protein